MHSLIVVGSLAVATVLGHPIGGAPHVHLHAGRNPATGEPLPIRCGTQEVYEFRQSRNLTSVPGTLGAPSCLTTSCDDPFVRDAVKVEPLHIRVAFTVINNALAPAALAASVAAYQAVFAAANIIINVMDTQFVTDTTYGTCIPAYDNTDDWYNAIYELKNQHAVTPENTLNIFVTCQTPGPDGTLLGIATFPWDAAALTGYGGLWMNAVALEDPQDATLAHETGHCLGLWHTFHGYDEVNYCKNAVLCPGSNSCCERPHVDSNVTGATANLVGDHCADTAAQPLDYYCGNPAGKDCKGDAWTKFGNVDFANFMGYAMVNPSTGKTEHCQDNFSPNQVSRMHCYLTQQAISPYVCLTSDCN